MENTDTVKEVDNPKAPLKAGVNYIPVSAHLNWDEYFMLQAMTASFRSKDPSTKVGCVFVDHDNHQITMGYNGAVAGVDESQIPWGNDRNAPLEDQKYGYVIHAEANAIIHSPRSLKGSRCYVTLFPCNECAKMIASQRITEVIYLSDKYDGSDENKIAKKIFDLAGVKYRRLDIDQALLEKLHHYLTGLLV